MIASKPTCVGCSWGLSSAITSEMFSRDTWQWRKTFSTNSISLKLNPVVGFAGDPGQNWHFKSVTACGSQSHTCTYLRWWFPDKSFIAKINIDKMKADNRAWGLCIHLIDQAQRLHWVNVSLTNWHYRPSTARPILKRLRVYVLTAQLKRLHTVFTQISAALN